MIAENSGNWRHDYTLAQPHNILERAPSPANPSDYVSTPYYHSNPYANGRHVYQANQVILAETKAPLMHAVVQRIEKQQHHLFDWESKHPYRLIIKTKRGTQKIYSKEIDICTGLGPAKSIVPR